MNGRDLKTKLARIIFEHRGRIDTKYECHICGTPQVEFHWLITKYALEW